MLQLAEIHAAILSHEELAEMQRLDPVTRQHLRNYLDIFEALRRASKISVELKRQAEAYSHCAGNGWGYSARTLQRRYSEWQKAGQDWRVLIPNWNNGDNRLGLPRQAYDQFVRWWIGEWASQTARDEDGLKGAWRRMINEVWLAGQSVPGIGTIAEWHMREYGRPWTPTRILRKGMLPRGMTYDTLRRIYHEHLSAGQRIQVARGFHAAHGAMPDQLLRDTSGLGFMQYIVFDDLRPDIQVIAPDEDGRLRVMWTNVLLGLDLSSRCHLAFGIKPRIHRQSDDKNMGLSRADMRFLLLHMFERWGLPEHEVTLLVENAAAAISPADERALLDTFGGRIRVDRTGIYEKRLVKDGWKEQGGMPYQKGWIESFFRLLNTTTASLPGTTGRRYHYDPASLPARIHETERLLKKVNRDPVAAQELEMPLLHLDQLQDHIERALNYLAFRTDHKLEGFNHVTEYLLEPGSDWRPIDELQALPAPEREAVYEIRQRPEAPAERFVKLYKATPPKPLDPALYAHLYRDKRELAPSNGRWVWSTGKGQPDIIFRDPDNCLCSHELENRLGTRKLLCYLSDDRNLLHITDEGKYLGAIARQNRVDVADREAIKAEAARVASARNADTSRLREYLQAPEADLRNMRANNVAALERWESAPVVSDAASRIESTETAAADRVKSAPTRKRQRDTAQADRWAEQAELARAQDDDFDTF